MVDGVYVIVVWLGIKKGTQEVGIWGLRFGCLGMGGVWGGS
jgi:hypothetical protein